MSAFQREANVPSPLAFVNRLARPAGLIHHARQFNNGLVRKNEASGASVRKDVEGQLLSAAPAISIAGKAMFEDSAGRPAIRFRQREARATAALVLGTCSIVLIYPLGLMLGPLALWFGISAIWRIQSGDGHVAGLGLAIAGTVTGGIVSGFYALILLLEVVAFLLSGGPIPAY